MAESGTWWAGCRASAGATAPEHRPVGNLTESFGHLTPASGGTIPRGDPGPPPSLDRGRRTPAPPRRRVMHSRQRRTAILAARHPFARGHSFIMAGRPPHTGPRTGPSGQAANRQFVKYTFFKVASAWRGLPADERAAMKREIGDILEAFAERMLLRVYST